PILQTVSLFPSTTIKEQVIVFFYRRDFFKKFGLMLASYLTPKSMAAEAAPAAPKDAAPLSSIAQDGEMIKADYDLIVVGGGISGTSTAISAARQGLRVALVHERSMLGGNSSSEVKLFPENNSGFHPWIKEGGIHEEFHTEERVRNHLAYV